MSFLTGHSNHTWEPVMTADTTNSSYWLNWRFLLCAIWISLASLGAAFIIWRYEGCCSNRSSSHGRGNRRDEVGILYKDEAWTTCCKKIHPLWLLGYRVIGFGILLTVILADTIVHSARIFYFYTEWTFTLVTIYFFLATIFSIHGCLHYCHDVRGVGFVGSDAEQGTYVAPTLEDNANSHLRNLKSDEESYFRSPASVWGYFLQIVFQTCAGAVVLTDVVFWLVIYPFLTSKDYGLDVLKVSMHSVNVCILIGDVILNNLRFPFFRVAYFVLWTCIFVIFQWIIHACVSLWWPYPFMDLSSPFAPLWYLAVGLLTIPCFGVFAAIMKLKKLCWSKVQTDSSSLS